MKHIYIRTSPIEGMGVFAGENIKRGDVIQHIKGEARFLAVSNKEESLSFPNWIGIGKDKWIDPDFPNQFLNHSCNPNAGVRGRIVIDSEKKAKGKYEIVAMKTIKEGEEIAIDYAMIEGDDLWEMECHCGNKNCRKIVRSVRFIPKKQFEKYLPYIPTYFKNLYIKEHKKNSPVAA